jgi:hypothetical protein
MAEVNHLEAGVNPPEEEHTVVVARDVTGGFYVISSEPGYRRGAEPHLFPVAEGERNLVIERAKALADKTGVSTVYVVN